MANAKIILDKRRANKEGAYPLSIQIAHKGKTRPIPFGIHLQPEQWDGVNMEIKKFPNSKQHTIDVTDKLTKVRAYLLKKQSQIKSMDVNELKERVIDEALYVDSEEEKKPGSEFLGVYAETIIQRALTAKKPKTAQWYATGVSAFKKFNGGQDIRMLDITVDFLEDFIAEYSAQIKKNSINNYLRAVRAIMGKAKKDKKKNPLPGSHDPFVQITLPSNKTKKRGLDRTQLTAIRELDLAPYSPLWHNRNYFLFSFNMRGMNFIDLANLKWKQIKNGRVFYVRAKTNTVRSSGKEYSIKLTEEARRIIGYYQDENYSPEDFVFPILSKKLQADPVALRIHETYRLKDLNSSLKQMAKMAGINENITSYWARHSWAKLARKSGVPTDQIGSGLGHSDLKTTEIYLEDFEDDVLDEVNEVITL